QGGRGINVSANALTWLKRLTLKGIDLPELYVKTREKLLAYDAESNEKVREVIKELGHIGMIIGDKIELDSVSTNYFLLLGQSISSEIIPTKNTQGEK
ncbi:MAG TPA: CRISPR-associated protein, partial [Candidatus Marinimicrobia bacterium]|nr:CRISPR-associated protein [Candidatus Neomarinimicrobiota bacterium]